VTAKFREKSLLGNEDKLVMDGEGGSISVSLDRCVKILHRNRGTKNVLELSAKKGPRRAAQGGAIGSNTWYSTVNQIGL